MIHEFSLPSLVSAARNGDGRQLSETLLRLIQNTRITFLKSFTIHNESPLLISLKVRRHFLSLSVEEQERKQSKTNPLFCILQENPSLTSQMLICCRFSWWSLEKLHRVQWH